MNNEKDITNLLKQNTLKKNRRAKTNKLAPPHADVGTSLSIAKEAGCTAKV